MSALSACASIWGFQEPTELDAGADATTEATTAEAGNDVAAADDATGDAPRDTSHESAALDGGPGSDADADADADVVADGPAGVCNTSCVPAAPFGWEGPVAIYKGSGAAPSCDEAGTGAFPVRVFLGNDQLDAPDASCTCACGAPEGGACGAAIANYFSNNTCTTSCGSANQPIATTCTQLGLSGCGGTHFAMPEPTASGGNCAPVATTTVVDASWGVTAEGCGLSAPNGAGCGTGAVCVPAADAPFVPGNYCIVKGGSYSCQDGGFYPFQYTYYTDKSPDSRGCTACTCGAATGATCTGGTFTTYGNGACSGGSTSFPLPVTCGNLGGAQGGEITGVTYQPGTCAPIGGQPTGSVQPSGPTTVCCSSKLN